MREANLNLAIARELHALLERDPRFTVLTVRDLQTGNYTPDFARYFSEQEESIRAFRSEHKSILQALFTLGLATERPTANHGYAPEEVSLRLYGINKWADEQEIDIALHIHLNDHPRPAKAVPGDYTGFAIYVPEAQYPNAYASADVARAVFRELRALIPVSDLHFEQSGIVEDQELIAVGANASREGVALLIEYGYIYEPQFRYKEVRDAYFRELAFRTYRALAGYFKAGGVPALPATQLLPYRFTRTLEPGTYGAPDVLALQAALQAEALYPPPGKDLRQCPLTGNYGPCTEEAVRLFQARHAETILAPLGIPHPTGIAGPATQRELNALVNK
ncbi:MAG: peptidoglycan-binding protein [Candidatus Liptonbacteria bacterium]|nr:peptidoglycan-binding protein [Candidatus Liptonbacteria bacterium]